MMRSFVLRPCGPLVSQVMLTSTTCASGFLDRAPASPFTPFNPVPQGSELVKHSGVPIDIGHRAFACNVARWKDKPPLAESAQVRACKLNGSACKPLLVKQGYLTRYDILLDDIQLRTCDRFDVQCG
jgi:hypothetical protein